MAGIPNNTLVSIALPGGNADLPAPAFPTLTRISVIDLVGPNAANRQQKSLEKRSVSLAQLVNALIENSNVLDVLYLRRDGTPQQDTTSGMTGDLPMQGNQLADLGEGTATGNAVEFDQFVGVVNLLAPLDSPALTGTPTTVTPPPSSDDDTIPNTSWVKDILTGFAAYQTAVCVECVTISDVKHVNGGGGVPQTVLGIVQVERSAAELSREIELAVTSGHFNYPGDAPAHYLLSLLNGVGGGSPWQQVPMPTSPIFAAEVKHDDNDPRTRAHFRLKSVRHTTATDSILVEGNMVHRESVGALTLITRPAGVYSFSLLVGDPAMVLFVCQNQKGNASISLRAFRDGPGLPAKLEVSGSAGPSGHGNDFSSVGIWLPYRAIANFPA